MNLHDSTACRLALAFTLTATAFGCGSEGDAVEEDVSSAELASQSLAKDNTCCPPGDEWGGPRTPFTGDDFYDKNGDGLICFREGIPGEGNCRALPHFVIKDNNNPCGSAPP